MLKIDEIYRIRVLYDLGYSKTEISREVHRSRTTVIKYLKRDRELRKRLNEVEAGSVEHHRITEELTQSPVYSGKYKKRKRKKYTPEIDQRIDEIIQDDRSKDQTYESGYKLNKTAKQIHKILIEEGYDISYSTVCKEVRNKKAKRPETLILQVYD